MVLLCLLRKSSSQQQPVFAVEGHVLCVHSHCRAFAVRHLPALKSLIQAVSLTESHMNTMEKEQGLPA